MGFEKQEESRI